MPFYILCAILSGVCLLLALGFSLLYYTMSGSGVWIVRTLKVGAVVVACVLAAVVLLLCFGPGAAML